MPFGFLKTVSLPLKAGITPQVCLSQRSGPHLYEEGSSPAEEGRGQFTVQTLSVAAEPQGRTRRLALARPFPHIAESQRPSDATRPAVSVGRW